MISGKVAQFIERENLFSLKDKVLVALSGGADSVALLRLLITMKYALHLMRCRVFQRSLRMKVLILRLENNVMI